MCNATGSTCGGNLCSRTRCCGWTRAWDCARHLLHYFPVKRIKMCNFFRYGKDFQRISRRFMPQVNVALPQPQHVVQATPASPLMFCHTPQHDPKKLEFIYNLRSRRPGSSGILKGTNPLKYSRLFLITDPRLRQRCAVGCAARTASCWAVVVVVSCDEGPQSGGAAA